MASCSGGPASAKPKPGVARRFTQYSDRRRGPPVCTPPRWQLSMSEGRHGRTGLEEKPLGLTAKSRVCGVLGILGAFLLHGQTQRQAGRLLPAGEMAGIFGDITANNLCWNVFTCSCTNLGSDCTVCANSVGGGNGAPLTLCCVGIGKFCQENGAPACGGLFIWYVEDWTTAKNCCTPCKPINQNDWDTNKDPCDWTNAVQGSDQGC